MRRTMAIAGAAVLLVAGATAAAAAPEPTAAHLTTDRPRTPDLLVEVLDELVADGVINRGQADAIVASWETKRSAKLAELREKHAQRHAERKAAREQIRGFLEDGVISADELAQLPEDHPLRTAQRFLEDGQITREALRELRRPFRLRHGGFAPAPAPDADGTGLTAPVL